MALRIGCSEERVIAPDARFRRMKRIIEHPLLAPGSDAGVILW